jgi:tetratricopeptide (TPR) repeat protein
VLSRLDQLQERPKTLLKVASVVGRVFHASWLAGIYPELGAASEIVANLKELSRQNFTVYDPSEGEDTYYFRNIITRSVIYDSLLHSLRTALHEQTGEFLEAAYPGQQDQYLDLLAYHFDHGLDLDKKRYYLRRAGEFAQNSYANQAAIDYFRKVLPLLVVPDQVDVKQRMADVEKLIGKWEDAKELLKEAMALADTIGDKTAAGWCQVSLGELERVQGNYTAALDWLERARRIFERTEDGVGLAQVLHYSGTVAAQQGDLDTAEERYKESLALRRKLNDQLGITNLLNNLAIVAEYRQDYEAARDLHEEALAIRRELGDRRLEAFSLSSLGHLLKFLGDFTEARARLEESVVLLREIGDRYQLATALDNLGNVVTAQGSYDEGRALYDESLAIIQDLGDGWAAAYILEDVARLIYLEKQSSDALVLLSAAGALREEIDAPLPGAEQVALEDIQKNIEVELGPAFSRDCLETGRSLSMDEAIIFARRTISLATN